MSHKVLRLTAAEFNILTPRLVDIYLQAMGYPRAMHAYCAEVWHQDSQNSGFTSVIGLVKGHEDAWSLAGVAYGFDGYKEHWWSQELRQELARSGTCSNFPGSNQPFFQIEEIHVIPSHQGHGLGRQLLTTLLKAVPAPMALLSTPEVPQEDNNAFKLYRSLGFTDLLRDFTFKGDNRPFAILKSPLPLTPR